MEPDGMPGGGLPRSRILYSLLLILLLVGVVPLVLNSYYLIAGSADKEITYTLEVQNEMLSSVAETTYAYLRTYRTKLEDMAMGYAMNLSFQAAGNLFDTTVNEQALAERLKGDRNLIQLGSVKLDGGGRRAAKQDLPDATIEKYWREAVDKAGKGQFAMSPPYYYEPMRDTLIVMAVPVAVTPDEAQPAPKGEPPPKEVRGIVFAVVSLNELQVKLSENIKRGLTLFVLDAENRLVAHTDEGALKSGRDLSTHPLVREFADKQGAVSSTVSYPLTEGDRVVEYIGTAMPVRGEWKWAVFGQSDKGKAYRGVQQNIRQSAMAVLVVLAIVVVVGVVFGVSISSPIQLLAEGSLRLARGEYAEKISFHASNELGQLASVFNYMSQEIQERERKLKSAAEENEHLFLGTIRTLAAAIDAKDPYTRGHSERVTFYTVAIAEEMGMDESMVQHMRISALLHDVGKIGIDDTILRKPGALTDEEYEIMKGHPQKGAEIMAPIRQMKKFIPGIRFHHETLAGTGYPLGLRGDQIPVEALIIQVADTFDAMTTDRPYQKGMEVEAALDRIQSFVGKRYDQRVVNALKTAVAKGKVLPGLKRRPDPTPTGAA